MICDKEVRANIVHYGSSRCKRVTRSVMEAEVHAFILSFDQAFVLRDQQSEMIGRDIDISAYVYSKTLFDTVAKGGTITDKRLLIDIWALREGYVNGELNRLSWLPGKENPADSLTKPVIKTTSPIGTLMNNNVFKPEPVGW